MSNYTYKIASESSEFDQIHRLNYRTFVNEIPQHQPNPEQRLLDPFHNENCYIIALHEQRLVGMVALREQRPFSLDAKLPDLDAYLPTAHAVCEIRLLAVEREHRNGTIFAGLLRTGMEYALNQGYDLAIMSGTVRQLKLYAHLGFVPFGPRVGTGDAMFQPMYITWKLFHQAVPWLRARV